MDKEKAIKRYEGFIRFVLRKPSRYTKENLNRADLLRRNICKSGGNVTDASKAYIRARDAVQCERALRVRIKIKNRMKGGDNGRSATSDKREVKGANKRMF